MIAIEPLSLGELPTNCYLAYQPGDGVCTVIDPADEAPMILARCRELGVQAAAILLTHGHFDHVGAVEDLLSAANCALWMSEEDDALPSDAVTAYLYPLAARELPNLHFCKEGDAVTVGSLTFTVLATPGHTKGSVCYLCESALFSGDTLFAGSCGRTDLPGGSSAAMNRSLARLAALPGDYAVYPGHGASTTLDAERRNNPYLWRAP